MADNNNKLLVVLDKYVDRASELVVVTTKTKNRNSVEASSADTMDMKTFISRSFSTKMYVNIFDAATEEWLWKTNPKVTHIHERCVELWGPKDKVEKEEELEEEELETDESVEEEPESEEPAEEADSDDSEPAEESVEEEPESEEPAEEADSDESEPTEESKQDLFAAARQAAADRKAKDSSTISKPSTKANSSKPSKKVKPLKKATELEEDLDEEEELEETTKKSGFLIWVLSIIVVAITAISIYLAFKPGKELETLGLTAQYVEATNRLNKEVEPAWYRWESWDRQVAAEATLVWGPYFRALYVTGEGANPTPNSVQLYAVYLTLKVLVQQGHEPGDALRIIREDSSKVVIDALNKGNISSEDIIFIKKYMMK